jgi:hypothetical protein
MDDVLGTAGERSADHAAEIVGERLTDRAVRTVVRS